MHNIITRSDHIKWKELHSVKICNTINIAYDSFVMSSDLIIFMMSGYPC